MLSSHRSGLGRRKPAGGCPEGVACRRAVVENVAAAMTRFAVVVLRRRDAASVAAGRLRATSIKGFADAIVVLPVAEWVEEIVCCWIRSVKVERGAVDINQFAMIG